jgi:hypothetical protein
MNNLRHAYKYTTSLTDCELEKEINGVGAPLAGLVRSTKADLMLSALCFAVGVGVVVWFAA